ncbi:tetratricopeptide repeat protein [Bacteroidota bacterium]
MKKSILMLNMLVILSVGIFTECKCGDKKAEKLFKEPIINYNQEEYMAFIMNSTRMWEGIVKKNETNYLSNPDDTLLLYNLVRSYVGYTNACIGNQNKETFDLIIQKAERYSKILTKLIPDWAKAFALESAIISSKLAFEPQKGMMLGPKNQKAIDKAIKLNDKEPLAWYQIAGNKLHTPEQFGGSVPKAIEYYLKSIELFEHDSNLLTNNWQYLNALTWIGIAYDKAGKYPEAVNSFNKALEFEPDFGWIKFVLMPDTKKKMAELSINQ